MQTTIKLTMTNPTTEVLASSLRRSARHQPATLAGDSTNESEKEDGFDVSDYLNEVAGMESEIVRSVSETTALRALDITRGHHRRQDRLEKAFLEGVRRIVTKENVMKWGKMLELIPNPHWTPRMSPDAKVVPRCFVLFGGDITHQKLSLCNDMLIDWQMNYKKQRFKEGECPWYSVDVQNMEVRTFLAHMAKTCTWRYTTKHFSNFEGSLLVIIVEINDFLLLNCTKIQHCQRQEKGAKVQIISSSIKTTKREKL